MANQTFKLENRMTPRNMQYECPRGYSFTKNGDWFILTGKRGDETYVFRFKEGNEANAIREIRKKVREDKVHLYWVGFTFRDLIQKYL